MYSFKGYKPSSIISSPTLATYFGIPLGANSESSPLATSQKLDVLENKVNSILSLCSNIKSDLAEAARVPLKKEEGFDMKLLRMRVCVGYKPDGSPKIAQISGETQLEMADNAVRAILGSERRQEFVSVVVAGVTPAVPKVLFEPYVREWLKTYKTQKLRENTKSGYTSYLRRHIFPAWASTPIDEITTRDIQNFLNDRKDMSGKTLREMLNLLKQIFDSAVEDKIIAKNPAKSSRISNPGKASVKREAIDEDTMRTIIQGLPALQENDRRFLALAIYSGMRKGEIIGLQWSDIDLERNVIHVRRSANVNKGKAILGETKSEAGTRDIPIMPELMKNLVPIKSAGYVLTSTKDPTGQQPISGTVYNCMIKRIDKTISLHGATAHVFRHTLGTLVYSETKDVKIVQDILGHSDFKTTADRYVHPEKSREQSAMERVNNVLLRHDHNEADSAAG